MKKFSGFPPRMLFTSIPNLFFSHLLPQIDDITELKVTLHIFHLLYHKRSYPRFITYKELTSDNCLASSLGKGTKSPNELLREALGMATKRGTIIHIVLDSDGISDDIYFLNSKSNSQTVVKIQNGELDLPGLRTKGQISIDPTTEEQSDIFTLYEQNIGMITPMIAEELREAEKLYPEAWIKDAVKEATDLNKRSWRYIARILERWTTEGKSDGTYKRNSKKTDPDKYIKGKYGHMVRR